jgi:hypothetical protein
VRAALFALVAACSSHSTPLSSRAGAAGITIALYARGDQSFAVVDDRRWVSIAGASLMLANIDPGAELASLVIEPQDAALRIGPCVRERLPDLAPKDPLEEYAEIQRERRALELRLRLEHAIGSGSGSAQKPAEPEGDRFVPVVKCDASGKPGRHLVRVIYVTKRIGYRAQHDIEIKDDKRAQVTTRFAIMTPIWQQRAELVLYDGVPGGDRSPREVARGPVTLDGSTAVIAVPTREVASQVRRVYDGAVITSEDSSDVMWGHDSVQAVWVWLELAKLRLAPGPVRVHLDLPGEGIRDLDVAATSRKQDDTPDAALRLPLWVDESLRGSRQRIIEYNDGASLQERYLFGIANTGDATREVWIEERMRTAAKRRLDRAWPKKPTADRDILRTKLEIKVGRIERAGYTLTYDF